MVDHADHGDGHLHHLYRPDRNDNRLGRRVQPRRGRPGAGFDAVSVEQSAPDRDRSEHLDHKPLGHPSFDQVRPACVGGAIDHPCHGGDDDRLRKFYRPRHAVYGHDVDAANYIDQHSNVLVFSGAGEWLVRPVHAG